MNECVKKRQADDVVAKNYVKMHAVQSQAWQMHRRKKAHNARNLLSSREATFSEHDFWYFSVHAQIYFWQFGGITPLLFGSTCHFFRECKLTEEHM